MLFFLLAWKYLLFYFLFWHLKAYELEFRYIHFLGFSRDSLGILLRISFKFSCDLLENLEIISLRFSQKNFFSPSNHIQIIINLTIKLNIWLIRARHFGSGPRTKTQNRNQFGFGLRISFYTFWYRNQQMFIILNTQKMIGKFKKTFLRSFKKVKIF